VVGAFGVYGNEEKNLWSFWLEDQKKRYILEEPSVDRKSNTLTTDLRETGWKRVGIINVVISRGQ
jgi:hypothetical protein